MSSETARKYHSMTFTYANEWDDPVKKHGQINTWDDWHLIPSSRPVFDQPKPKYNFLEIPGSDGVLDLSESLANRVLYNNREGTLDFIVANDYRNSWAAGHSQFANWLHGKKIRAVLDDDRGYFYEGRFAIDEWRSNNNGTWSNIVLSYNLDPYKYAINTTMEPWLWDPFSFEDGVIYKYDYIPVGKTGSGRAATTTVKVFNGQHPVIPKFHISFSEVTNWKIIVNNSAADFVVNRIADIEDTRLELKEGENEITITGLGIVAIEFRGTSL